ncbi:uncharacterized protein N7483_010358 [Penicillium malachiteum]|uniref:uncharacterized protein n=1 Tax=Penicillium malachiteum TaxID=1324776 RepID=UPI002549985C|nr:uncharacterized protein N7483_010358 [Penicillium malachiteum]KAJ5713177.1 hypothetical protein N7483_010358 [Penicillium malachiteum]
MMGFWELIQHYDFWITFFNILSVYLENWRLKWRVGELEAEILDLHKTQAACWCRQQDGPHKEKRW